jgi:hypothetical protein
MVAVGVKVNVAVAVGVGVIVNVAVAVGVIVGVAVGVGVYDVGVEVGVRVYVGVGVAVGGVPWRMMCGFSQMALSFFCAPLALTTRMNFTVSPASPLRSRSTG